MRFPFVSRLAYDLVVDRLTTADARVSALEQRLDTLLVQLSIQLSERASPPTPLKRPDADPIQEVIRLRAGTNGTIRRALALYVRNARAQDVSEDDICQGVLHWASSDDDGVDG
jgi:hypothetical protein